VLNGSKRWIGLGNRGDLIVVWARSTQDGQVGAFVVEKGAPGYQARVIEGKVSAALGCGQATSRWTTCGCRPRTGCPGRGRSRTPAGSWPPPGAPAPGRRLGHATAAYDTALRYALERRQFGEPLASFQIIQQRLVAMLADLTAMQALLRCRSGAWLRPAG